MVHAKRRKICGGVKSDRKLTPIEYEWLQTSPDNYTAWVSNAARYTAVGNGWTVDVIAYVLRGLREETK